MKRIVFYKTTSLEYGGGLEKYIIETAAQLAERPGLTVDVITMDNDFTDRIVSGLSVFYMKKIDKKLSYKEDTEEIRKKLGKANYYKLHTLKELRERLNDYDVVYSKNELIEAFIFKFCVGYKNIPPVIFGGHTPIYYPVAQSFHTKLHNFLYASIYRFLASGVQKFHAINQADAERYKQLFPKRDVIKIYNPFDVKRFDATAKKFPYTMPHTEGAIRILWVGRLTEQKGVADLVQIIPAVNKVLAGNATVEWNIFGDGELRELVQKLSEQEQNVHFFGHIEQKNMASIYSQHDIFLSTSKWEGYPYTLIEAQAFGLQLFAYNIPGPADILPHYDGGRGHLANDTAAMVKLLSDNVMTYTKAGAVPKSPASDQFKPQNIYDALIAMLTDEKRDYENTGK